MFVEVQGKKYEVPDDATPDEIDALIGNEPAQVGAPTIERQKLIDAVPVMDRDSSLSPEENFARHTARQAELAAKGPTVEPGIMDTVGSTTEYLMNRGVEGFMNFVGLPQATAGAVNDLAAGGLRAAGMDAPDAYYYSRMASPTGVLEYALPSAEGMKQTRADANDWIAQQFGLGPTDTRRPAENIVEAVGGRIAEEVGATGGPMAIAAGRAAQVGQAGRANLSAVERSVVEPYIVNPVRAAAKDMSVAVGAGTGASLTTYGQEQPSPAADLIGAILGAGSVAASSGLLRSGTNVFGAIARPKGYTDSVVNEAVTDNIMRNAEVGSDATPLIEAITRPNRTTPAAVIPGYQETLADATQNPGLAAFEYGQQTGPNAGKFVTRRNENSKAVNATMSGMEPTTPPAALRAELSDRRDQAIMDAITRQQAATAGAEAAVRPITPQTTAAQRGNVVRTQLEEQRDLARERTHQAYQDVGIEGRQVSPEPLTATLDQQIAGLTEAERTLVPQGLVDRVSRLGRPTGTGPVNTGLLDASGNPITRAPDPPAPIDLKEATDLKSELQRLQRAAAADPRAEKGGRNASRVIGDMVARVDGFINSNLSPDEIAKLDAARGAKFDEAQSFTRQGDPVAAALARNEGGVPKVRDDLVAKSFTHPQAMDRLFTQADTPQTRAAIRDEVLSNADMTTAEKLTRFRQDYGEQLQRFPGLDAEVETAVRARSDEAGATQRRAEVERDLGTPTSKGQGTVGKYLQFSDANSERAINEVLMAKDPGKAIDEILEFAGNSPQAVEGARSAFWKKMRTESTSAEREMGGDRMWRGDWLKSWLDKPANRAVAERLYRDNPEHLANLDKIAGVLDSTDLRTRARAPASSGTGQGVNQLLTPETLQSRLYAMKTGKISPAFLGTSIAAVIARRATKAARSDAIERLTTEALLNPEFAKKLLTENNPANRAAMARYAKGWQANELKTVMDLLQDDEGDPDAELKARITDREKT